MPITDDEFSMNEATSDRRAAWQALGHFRRGRIVASARRLFARDCDELAEMCVSAQRPDPLDTISSELVPLCAALKFLGRRGAWILRTRRHGLFGRPVWLWGVRSKVVRAPRGDVLVLAAWNYPILLAGVQVAQALAAGNRVWLKSAPGCEAVTDRMVSLFHQAGVPQSMLTSLPSAPQSAIDRIEAGVDLVVLTGSSATGRKVLELCAQKLTPAIVELSGCDAVVVGPSANLKHTAKMIRFALMFNGGATCIGPRRIIAHRSIKSQLVAHLQSELVDASSVKVHPAAVGAVRQQLEAAIAGGAQPLLRAGASATEQLPNFAPVLLDAVAASAPIANSDLFAPIASMIDYQTDDEAARIVNDCRYRLAASIFGGRRWAKSLAGALDVGSVTINDIMYPTADPRLPFGGRGESGFGVTRGPEGLLQMTQPRVISVHRGLVFLHLLPKAALNRQRLAALLTLTHGRWIDKPAALRRLVAGSELTTQNHGQTL